MGLVLKRQESINSLNAGPEIINLFFMLNSTEHELSSAKKLKYRQIKNVLALSLTDVVLILLINVKMQTIIDILTFMRRINFLLS